MADLDKLYAALEQADAAGATDDARDIAAMIREQKTLSQEPETSTMAALGHGVLRGALPAAAGIVSGGAGAVLGAPAGPAGVIAGGLGAGFAGSAAAAAAQEKFLEAHPELAKTLGLDAATAAKEAQQHPYASMTGEIAPNLLAFRPSAAMFRSGKGLAEDAAKALKAEKIAAGVNATVGAGVGAGVQAGQEAMGDEPIDWTKVGIAGLAGTLGQKETALGRGLTRIGEAPASAASKAAVSALRRPGEVAPEVVPEVATEAVKAISEPAAETVPASTSQDMRAMIDELEGRKIIEAEKPAAEIAIPETKVAPEAIEPALAKEIPAAPELIKPSEIIPAKVEPEAVKVEPIAEVKAPTIGEQVQTELKDLYKQSKSLSSEKDDLNVWLRKVGINTQDRADMGIPKNSKDYPHVFRNQAQRLDVLMHDAIEGGIISEADLARFPDPVEGFRQLAKDAIDGNFAATPKNMETQAKLQAIQERIDHLESIPKEQYGLKAETVDEARARMDQEATAKKAQEDAAIQADMDAQAERDRAEIARRSQEQADQFALGQTPEESLTGQKRIDLDEDIPFELPAAHTEKFAGDVEELGKTLRASMDKMGLKDVGLTLADSINARVAGKMESVNGAYLDKMITLSLKGDDIHRTMNHESLHAMRDNGFFNDAAWKLLSEKANKEWMQKYGISKDYGHLPKDLQHEEAIAKAFADYRTQPPAVKSIMAKAIDMLKRIGNVLRGRGYKNADDIFKSAAEGKLAGTNAKMPKGAMFEKSAEPVTAKNVMGQSIGSNWEAPPVNRFTEFTRLFQNKHVDLKRTVEAIKKEIGEIAEKWNPYQKEGLYHSKVANRSRVFVESEVDPLVKKMVKLKVNNEELHDYLHNRHAEEYNKQMNKINPDIIDENGNAVPYGLKDRASGIHTDEARKYLENLDPKKKADLESIAKDLDNIVKGTQKLLVESGQEKESTIQAWNRTYEHYVPLFRQMEENRIPTLTKRGMGVSGGFSKRAMGSEREVADIANSIIGQREKAIEIAEKMEVDHALYGLAIKAPNPDVWLPVNPDAIKNPEILARELQQMGLDGTDIVGMMQERKTRVLAPDPTTGLERVVYKTNPLERYKDNVLPIRINGEDRFIFFNKDNPAAANMVQALRNMDTPTVGLVGKNIGKATQWMAKVNTQWNPVFGALNFMRDFGSAMANLSSTELKGQQAKVAGGIKPAMEAIWKTMRAERSGDALPDTAEAKLYQEFRAHGGQTLYREQLVRRADQEKLINQKIKELNSNAAKKTASAFFNGLSDFNDTVENAIRLSAYKAAKDKGMSAEKAATIAKELTVNFDRKGAMGQQINNYFAFFNASAQGIARMTQTLKGPAGKKIMMGGLGLGALQAGMMEMAGFDDNDPPEFVKSRNFVIPTMDGKYIAIPYPLGLHFLPNIGRIAVETGLHGEPVKHAANMAAVIADSFNPLGGGNLSLQTIAPTVLDPAVALATNKDAFGKPISKEDRATAPTTGLSRSRDQSTEINKAVARAINYVTGGTEDTKGFLSPTADQLDFLAGQVTGGVGREAMKVTKVAKAAATGETDQLASYDIPLAGRFYGDIKSPAANSQHFYDNVTRLAEYEATIKGMRQRKENVAEYLRDNPEARLWQQANNVENQISALNKQKKQWREAGRSDEQIKTLDDRKQAVMTRFNERVKALKE